MTWPSHAATERLAHGYDLVVIGSSAGGIEALTALVATLPPDFGAALVIAQHLDPEHASHLGEILARHTNLPVHTVRSQEALQPGVIYVVPADRDVEITDHEVGLRPRREQRSTPSVNRLFTSAASAHGERLVGVILTGAGSDGASGARDVKAAGGMVIIENPATAAYASMPQSLAPSTVDLVVDLPDIGPLLGELVAGAYTPSRTEADTKLPLLLEQLRERSGIDFSTYKSPTILRRLQRRLAITRVETLDEYLTYLPAHPEEYQQLAASFLIKVTEFFRDGDLFTLLRNEILPNLIAHARAEGATLRFWSAGCATGEEAYSLAILVAELLGDDLDKVPVRIFATDVDADAIAFARRGLYPVAALATMPADLVARSFILTDDAYEVVPTIRNLVIFGQHDLGVRAPFPHIDLVLCRNVLIYFTTELQRRALQLFAFALRDEGYLVLGKAETPAPFAAYFAPVSEALKVYRRHGARVVVPPPRLLAQPLLPSHAPIARRAPLATPPPLPPVKGMATASEYVGSLLLNSSVGIVVVDQRYDIQSINRTAQQLLGLFRPALGEDLIHLVSAELAPSLRGVIDAAFARQVAQAEQVIAATVGEMRWLHVAAVFPASDAASATPDAVLLQITDVTARVQPPQLTATAAQPGQRGGTDAAAGPRVSTSQRQRAWEEERERFRAEIARLTAQLEQVTTVNGSLRRANDEYANVNLIVTGLNEDLVVRNEELQASTEEIKTLNEELQATNEELETLNEEMEATVEELRATNDDLNARTDEVQQLAGVREEQRQASAAKAQELTAILLSMSDALLVVNQAGDVLFTNAAYDELFGDAHAQWSAEDEAGHSLPPAEMPQRRAAGGVSFRMVFTQPTPSGARRWFEATGEPIKMGAVVTGGVLTVRDITDRSLRRLQDEFIALATHELRTPLTAIGLTIASIESRLGSAEAEVSPLLARILRQVQRLQRLINDLADVTRLQYHQLPLVLQPVDVREIAVHTIDSCALAMPTPPIVLDARDERLMILGDTVRLEQILTNLLSNAHKYAATSPQITVRIRRVAGEAEIAVDDDGPGIDGDALPHLFQRFYQIDPAAHTSRSGLGLGLFITHELVVALGGRIQVSSELGQGTTFTMHFPLLPPSDGATTA